MPWKSDIPSLQSISRLLSTGQVCIVAFHLTPLHSPLLLCANCTVLTCRTNGTVKICQNSCLCLILSRWNCLVLKKHEICVSWVHAASDLTLPSPWILRNSSFLAIWPWKQLRSTLSLWFRHGIPLLFFFTPHECNFLWAYVQSSLPAQGQVCRKGCFGSLD